MRTKFVVCVCVFGCANGIFFSLLIREKIGPTNGIEEQISNSHSIITME